MFCCGLCWLCKEIRESWSSDAIKWKHFLWYWPFARGIHRSPVNSPHKGQWRGALVFSLICAWIHGWVNNREVGDLRRHRAHYDTTVMNGTMWLFTYTQIAKSLESTSIRHRSDTFASDRCLIDVDPRVFAISVLAMVSTLTLGKSY